MAKLKWIHSYETVKFNTPDGDMHKNQYAVIGETIFVRKHPENNNQFVALDPDNLMTNTELEALLATMEEILVVPGEKMYYDEFELPDGRKYRVSSSKKDYEDLAKPNAKAKEKTVTNAEIIEIKKEDDKWQ